MQVGHICACDEKITEKIVEIETKPQLHKESRYSIFVWAFIKSFYCTRRLIFFTIVVKSVITG